MVHICQICVDGGYPKGDARYDTRELLASHMKDHSKEDLVNLILEVDDMMGKTFNQMRESMDMSIRSIKELRAMLGDRPR